MMPLKVIAAAFVALAVGGCVATEAAPETSSASALEAGGSCQSGHSRVAFIVVLGDQACRDVVTPSGRFRAAPLFPGAPKTVGACLMTWVGAGPADSEALARQALVVTPAPACDEPSAVAGDLTPLDGIPAFTGSAGCDVCGVVKRMEMFAVLPPNLTPVKEFQVALTNGQTKAFALDVPAGARAASVTLPPPPAGASYVEGRIEIY
jgi:hypothetical protein